LAEVRAVASLEDAEGHQHLAGGHRGGCEQMSPIPPQGPGGRDPLINKILHSDAFFGSENGQYQCFYQDPMHWGKGRLLEEAAE